MNEDIRIESTSSNAYAIYLDDEHIDTIEKLKNAPDRINAERERVEITTLAHLDKQANIHTSVTSALTRLKTIEKIAATGFGAVATIFLIYILGSLAILQLGAQEAHPLFADATLGLTILGIAICLLATIAYLVLSTYYSYTLFQRSAITDSDIVLSRVLKQLDRYAEPDRHETR